MIHRLHSMFLCLSLVRSWINLSIYSMLLIGFSTISQKSNIFRATGLEPATTRPPALYSSHLNYALAGFLYDICCCMQDALLLWIENAWFSYIPKEKLANFSSSMDGGQYADSITPYVVQKVLICYVWTYDA